MVRLRPSIASFWQAHGERFNPTMVRLRLPPNTIPDPTGKSFQSHYGAIATNRSWKCPQLYCPFQSHYGAIATLDLLRLCAQLTSVSIPLWCDCDCHSSGTFSNFAKFQSHYGAIATPPGYPICPLIEPRFNPTMVRLRQVLGGLPVKITRVSIPLWCDCDEFASPKTKSPKCVSIPLWCDCDFLRCRRF